MRNWLPAVLVRGPRRHADQQGRARSGRVWPPAEGGDRQQLCMSPRTHRRRGGPTDTASRPSWDAHGPAASGGTLGRRRGRPACSSPQKHRGRVRTSRTAPARCLVTARAAWLCRADRGRGADRTRGPHASHPELRPAPLLGSDFITGRFSLRTPAGLDPGCQTEARGRCPSSRLWPSPERTGPRRPSAHCVHLSGGRWTLVSEPRTPRPRVCGRTGTHMETQGPPAETWRQTGREPRPRRPVARWILRRTRREETLDTSLFPCFLIGLCFCFPA